MAKETNEHRSTLKNDKVALWLTSLSSSTSSFFFHCHFEFQFVCNGNAYKFYSYYMNNIFLCMRLKKSKKTTAQARIFKALFNSDSPLFELAFDILSNNFVSSSFFVHIFHSNDPSSFQRMRGKSARNSTTDGKESNVHCTSQFT